MARRAGLGKGLDSLIPVGSGGSGRKSTITEKKTADSVENSIKTEEKEEKAAEIKQKTPKTSTKTTKVKTESVDNSGKAEKKKTEEENPVSADTLLPLRLIEPNREQPRKEFREEELEELAESMKQVGIIQPLIVRKRGGHYEIVAGERRWRAAKLAGIREIPVVIRDYNNLLAAEVALIENLQRKDLNPMEEARAYQTLIESYSMTQSQVAERVAKSRTFITNSLRLLGLTEPVQKLVAEGSLSVGHAKVLLGLNESSKQEELAGQIVELGLSVRETERLVKKANQPDAEPKVKKELSNQAVYENLENLLKEKIGTKVSIRRKSETKGKVEIEYYSAEDLETITSFFSR